MKRTARIQSAIIDEIESRYPDPMAPFERAPSMSVSGDFFAKEQLAFFLMDFPHGKVANLKEHIVPLIRKHGIKSVELIYFEVEPIGDDADAHRKQTWQFMANGKRLSMEGMGSITFTAEGIQQHLTGQKVDLGKISPTVDGKPIGKEGVEAN